jgi:protoporphyrinogen oxidase
MQASNKTSQRLPVLVLGAGCAGLTAALELVNRGFPVVLIEKNETVGGLAGSVHYRGNIYEYGPHVFHSTDLRLKKKIMQLMGNELIEFKRTIKIKFRGKYFEFPLSMREVMFNLPVSTVLKTSLCLMAHIPSRFGEKLANETCESILKRTYGDVLYRLFFKDYITRVWGIPPSELSPVFATQRIPRLGLVGLFVKLKNALLGNKESKSKKSYLVEKAEGKLYTTHQGFPLIMRRMGEAFAQKGGVLLLGSAVCQLNFSKNKITSVDYRTNNNDIMRIECSGIVNTLPINKAVEMMPERESSPEIETAISELDFRAVVFVGLLIRKPRVLPASFMYFREHSFNRITDYSHFGLHIRPPGHTILVSESTCSVTDRTWSDKAYIKDSVIKDLVREGLIEEDDIEDACVFRYRYAYPIYKLGFEKHLSHLVDFIEGMENAVTTGRQGRFQYINTHVVMKTSEEAVQRLIKKRLVQLDQETSTVIHS